MRRPVECIVGILKTVHANNKSSLAHFRIFDQSMKLYRSIISSGIALLVLISSSSFTVNMHFCMDRIHSVSVIEKAAPCPMELLVPTCHKAAKHSCCDDEKLTFEGKNFKSQESVTLEIAQQNWIAALPVITKTFQPLVVSATAEYHNYKPPLIDSDIPVLIQSFLI